MSARDDFDLKTKDILAKRASFICSNPECRVMTIAGSDSDLTKFIYIGEAAHISSAADGGPRFNKNLSSDERKHISNGIFLCSNCAGMIDKNKGKDFSTQLLQEWKDNHEKWVKENLNKSTENSIVVIEGEHHARGLGEVTGLHIKKSAIIKPGTIVTAEGSGTITATKIG